MGWREVLFGKRDTLTAPVTMVGFPSDGGLMAGGVSATTTLGLSAVWRCIDILSNGVSQLEWRERQGTLDLPSSRIVLRPQAQRTRREWTSLVVSTLALFDVCYLWRAGGEDEEGVPLGLWYLDPTLVMPASADLFTQAFLLPPEEFFVAQQKVPATQLVVLHRSPQPTISDTAGGIINLARTTFAAAIAAERYASRYWQAGGSPTTVLETEQRLTSTQVTETSEAWSEKRARGPDYAPVLHGGLKARSFGADPTSESAVEARRELVADIGRYFGVPTRILNAPTGDSETYTSTPAANMDLIRYTLQNYIGAIEDGISDLLPGTRRMEMATRKLTVGTQYEQAQAYQLATASKAWMTPDEVRDETGLPPVEDAAVLNPPTPSARPEAAAQTRAISDAWLELGMSGGPRAQVGFQTPATLERAQHRTPDGRFSYGDGGGSAGGGGGGATTEERFSSGGTWDAGRVASVHEPYVRNGTAGLPTSDTPTVYMTGGGPASGKSTGILHNPEAGIPASDKAAHFDPDSAKAAIPEYKSGLAAGDKGAAAAVHEESSVMAKAGVNRALGEGKDVVYDTVGDSGIDKLEGKVVQMRSQGAKRIHADYATVPVDQAIRQSDARAERTGRFVPHDVITNAHADVSRTFVAAGKRNLFDRQRLWDTSTKGAPRLIAEHDGKGGFRVHDRKAWAAFRAIGDR